MRLDGDGQDAVTGCCCRWHGSYILLMSWKGLDMDVKTCSAMWSPVTNADVVNLVGDSGVEPRDDGVVDVWPGYQWSHRRGQGRST